MLSLGGAVACWLSIRVSLLCMCGCLAGVGFPGSGFRESCFLGLRTLRSDRQRQRLTRLSQEILSCRNAPERGLRMAPWLYCDGSKSAQPRFPVPAQAEEMLEIMGKANAVAIVPYSSSIFEPVRKASALLEAWLKSATTAARPQSSHLNYSSEGVFPSGFELALLAGDGQEVQYWAHLSYEVPCLIL